MMERTDICIVGSGFGSSVVAARLAQHLNVVAPGSFRILVVERGRDHTGQFDPDGAGPVAEANGFRHSYAPEYLSSVADVYADPVGKYRAGTPSLKVIGGRGIGGGSNIYCGVSLRTPTLSFERRGADGRRYWPEVYSRESLDPYYAMAEQQLRVGQCHWSTETGPHWQLATQRDYIFAEAAAKIGATAVPLKLSNQNDRNEGWWTQGRRFQGKQNLSQNYLQTARENGVEFWSECSVDSIAPDGDRYVLKVNDKRRGQDRTIDLEARMVFLGAGAVGSTGILLRSTDDFSGQRSLDQSELESGIRQLGQHLSANGDYGVTGFVGPRYERLVESHKGKPMASFCPNFFAQDQYIVIPFHTPPIYFAQEQISSLRPAEHPDALGRGSSRVKMGPDGREVPNWGRGFKDRLRTFSDKVLTMGCLSWDEGEGSVELGADGKAVNVSWGSTHPETEARWNKAMKTMQSLYRALDGEMMLDGYRKDGGVNTAHPLGGCRMAETSSDGIVDYNGEVFANQNLFVVDGAMIPTALGVNPSLTIAAVAESVADRLIRGVQTDSVLTRFGHG